MQNFIIPIANGELNAVRLNSAGERLCILLHGYGDTHITMLPIAQGYAAKNYEVVVFDLPFHGITTWQSGTCTASDIANILLFLLGNKPKPFEIIGYSLGGRLALASLAHLAKAEKIPEQIWLFAPAGAPQNWLHQYIEMPLFLKKWIAKLAENTSFLLKSANFLYQKKVITKFELAFAEKYLGKPKYRKMMFAWWFSLSFLTLNFREINEIIAKKGIKIHLFFGKKDTVLPKNSDIFYKKNLLHTSFTYSETTHRSIIEVF